jgi:NADH-quinone oxidoreductase subunit L
MTWPLGILAVAAIFAGFWGIDATLGRFFHVGGAEHGAAHVTGLSRVFEPFGHAPLAAFLGLFATVLGFSLAWTLYGGSPARDPLPEKLGAFARWMRDRFYFDEIYAFFIRVTHECAAALADWLDRWVIGGLLVRGGAGTVDLVGRVLRLAQSGNLQTYAFVGAAGVALMLWTMLS